MEALIALPSPWLLILIGVVAGVCSGMFGLGGGVVIVPALVALGTPGVAAVGTSVAVVLVNAVVGTVQHRHLGHVDLRRGLAMALGAALLAPLGSLVAAALPEALLRGSFAVMLLGTGIALYRTRHRPARDQRERRVGFLVGVGMGAAGGFLAGLFGIGGGTILVPLQVFAGIPMLSAVGTSLLVIIAGATSALASHFVLGNVHGGAALLIALGGVVGSVVGSRAASRVGNARLRVAFAIVLGVLVVSMAVQTWR